MRDEDGYSSGGENFKPLHGEDGGYERAAAAIAGVLDHDGGRERVVVADAEAEPEAEEAEGGHGGLRGVAEGEAGGDGAEDHEEESEAVDALAAKLVAKPAEEKLAGESAAEGDAVDGGGEVGREDAGLGRGGDDVIDAAEEFGDEGDAEEVLGVGEEAHSGDHHRLEVVPLHFCRVHHVEVEPSCL